jgi:hypothetical protein
LKTSAFGREEAIAISIKSGERRITMPIPDALTDEWLVNCITAGGVEQRNETWLLISGYRKTSVQFPDRLLTDIIHLAKQQGMTMNEYIEKALQKRVEEDENENT